ncbi:protein-S-isoprenylcysteine O-methyltransferase [Basidiobolus meristosporus CBS 931.73]|uniref:Protein-S-isoprenylcysteine O-methyltransferase n=1 Tax=Basidiobolus meristosporus CBS 931.73 TaxID=1314790 RepID=A0A1Y1YD43_9FUNG|nr:protein-S-isoprenylcysteine O-methyltransferase [Basidiobolus meristosporus CBS 931.73]|eukprot:ORX95912.1 protein-S-isoprenylcysteine O-methyltransferase [Basidiobolus meristosporus CBS 931.73]
MAPEDEQEVPGYHTIVTNRGILDGEHTPQNIASYGFLLGIVFGAGVVASTYLESPQLCLYLAALALFHFLEYTLTAMYNSHTLSLDSYLLNHSTEYILANALVFLEFLIERYFFKDLKTFGLLNVLGIVLVLCGQLARTLAMHTAKHNFTHQVASFKEKEHVLVTHGIYSIMRHPSYFGFYWWALGTQILLLNPIGVVGFALALHHFFSKRIAYEEYTLQRFFKEDYIQYTKSTGTLIPFIP